MPLDCPETVKPKPQDSHINRRAVALYTRPLSDTSYNRMPLTIIIRAEGKAMRNLLKSTGRAVLTLAQIAFLIWFGLWVVGFWLDRFDG